MSFSFCFVIQVCCGMGSAINNVHKDIYKAAKQCLTDRSMPVRCAAANCLIAMIEYAPFLYTTELENMAALCFRAFDGSTYEVRLVTKFFNYFFSTYNLLNLGEQA